jgi:hypothetical protein
MHYTKMNTITVFDMRDRFVTAWNRYVRYIPILPILLHYAITVNISSDCDVVRENGFAVPYLVTAHLTTLGGEVFYHLPRVYGSDLKKHLLLALWKGVLSTLQFFSFTYIRAKPYKCLDSYDEEKGNVVFWAVNIVVMACTIYFRRRGYDYDDKLLEDEEDREEQRHRDMASGL